MARKQAAKAAPARVGSVALSMPSTFAQYKTLLAKDLQQEFRTKEMLTSMGIYALLVLIVYGASHGRPRRQPTCCKSPAAFCGRLSCSRRFWA